MALKDSPNRRPPSCRSSVPPSLLYEFESIVDISPLSKPKLYPIGNPSPKHNARVRSDLRSRFQGLSSNPDVQPIFIMKVNELTCTNPISIFLSPSRFSLLDTCKRQDSCLQELCRGLRPFQSSSGWIFCFKLKRFRRLILWVRWLLL